MSAAPLSAETIAVIKSTAPVLQEHAEALTRLFYARMFEHNPEVKPYFNPAHQRSGEQQRALAGAIVAYATHIDRLQALGPAVRLIAHKHASLGVQPEHYPIVGENLLGAIAELLGEAATPEILGAWGEAYGVLAEILIAQEEALYQEHETAHGWRGFRWFRVARRVPESEEITSLHLEPVDGAPVAPHLPGQFLTVRLDDGQGATTMRNYSLSSAPGHGYRISVKREGGGYASGVIHRDVREGDVLEIGPPCGDFVWQAEAGVTRPVVLLAGGVGITPLLSMLHALRVEAPEREVLLIHAVRDGRARAFAQEVEALVAQHPNARAHLCMDEADAQDSPDTRGRLSLELLQRLIPSADVDAYFCGPPPFMSEVSGLLRALGVPEAQARFERFGPLLPLG